jgi:2-oxo-4-hydroxy-4-carboxy-5-ureidoimidazoline decarboxylase
MREHGLDFHVTAVDPIQIRLAVLNSCASEAAISEFERCCASRTWSGRMTEARPFFNLTQLEAQADNIWKSCSREDWLEAFAAHPRIGESTAARWSQQEQARVSEASAGVQTELARLNSEYEARFGHIFIICAAQKSGEEILSVLRQRLTNRPALEIQIAAEQQSLITRLRLRNLFYE